MKPLTSLVPPLVALVVSRLAILALFPAVVSDVPLYLAYAVRGVDLGQVPYRDFPVEYPPLAYAAVALPRLLDPTAEPVRELTAEALAPAFAGYHRLFRLEMAAFDLLAAGLFVLTVRRRRPGAEGAAAWAYTLAGGLLAPVLYDRLDAGLLLLLMLWAYGCARYLAAPGWGWAALASAGLGLGVSYKWAPVVAVPFFWWGLGRGRAKLLTGGVLVLTALGPFVPAMLAAGRGAWDFLRFHQARGLEVESLWASVLMLHPDARAFQGPGSWDLAGPWADRLAHGSTLLLLAAYAALALTTWRADRPALGYRVPLLVMLLTGSLAKVFSPQYLVWLLPLLTLAGAEVLPRGRLRWLVAASLLVALASTWLFPYHFFEFREAAEEATPNLPTLLVGLGPERPVNVALAGLLVVRNVGLVALIGWVGQSLFRNHEATSPTAPEPRRDPT